MHAPARAQQGERGVVNSSGNQIRIGHMVVPSEAWPPQYDRRGATCVAQAPLTSTVDTDSRLLETWGGRLVLASLVIWPVSFGLGFHISLAILTCLAFVVSLVFIARPVVGMLGVGMLCCLDTVSRPYLMSWSGGMFRWNTFNYFLLIVILLYVRTLLRQASLQIRVWQAFVCLVAIGVLASPSVVIGTNNLLNLVTPWGLLAFCLAGSRLRSVQEPMWFWVACVNGVLGSVGGLVYYLQRANLPRLDNNEFSYFPLTAMFCICLARSYRSGRSHALLNTLAAVNFCWVFLSGSRGSLLAAVICSIYLLYQTSGVGRRSLTIMVAACTCVLVVSQFPEMMDKTHDKFQRLADPSLSYRERTSGRANLFMDGWQIFMKNPLGVGTGGFNASRISSDNYVSFKQTSAVAAHSGWLKILVENGVVGIAFFLLFICSFSMVAARQKDPSLGLFVSATLAVAYVSAEFSGKGPWLLAAGSIVILQDLTRSFPRLVR